MRRCNFAQTLTLQQSQLDKPACLTIVSDCTICQITYVIKTLPKAQRTRGLSLFCQSKFLRSYHKFKHKSTSTKNLNQTSASPQNLKFKILTKPSFRISTKIQLHNLYKTSAEKNWPNSSCKSCLNFNFKILTKPCAQSLNKSLAF